MKSYWWLLVFGPGVMLGVMATIAFVDGHRTPWIATQTTIYGLLFVLGIYKSDVIGEIRRRSLDKK